MAVMPHEASLEARKNPGTGWVIDILWPDGETEAVQGFITEFDAVRWIGEYSSAWQRNADIKPSAPGAVPPI